MAKSRNEVEITLTAKDEYSRTMEDLKSKIGETSEVASDTSASFEQMLDSMGMGQLGSVVGRFDQMSSSVKTLNSTLGATKLAMGGIAATIAGMGVGMLVEINAQVQELMDKSEAIKSILAEENKVDKMVNDAVDRLEEWKRQQALSELEKKAWDDPTAMQGLLEGAKWTMSDTAKGQQAIEGTLDVIRKQMATGDAFGEDSVNEYNEDARRLHYMMEGFAKEKGYKDLEGFQQNAGPQEILQMKEKLSQHMDLVQKLSTVTQMRERQLGRKLEDEEANLGGKTLGYDAFDKSAPINADLELNAMLADLKYVIPFLKSPDPKNPDPSGLQSLLGEIDLNARRMQDLRSGTLKEMFSGSIEDFQEIVEGVAKGHGELMGLTPDQVSGVEIYKELMQRKESLIGGWEESGKNVERYTKRIKELQDAQKEEDKEKAKKKKEGDERRAKIRNQLGMFFNESLKNSRLMGNWVDYFGDEIEKEKSATETVVKGMSSQADDAFGMRSGETLTNSPIERTATNTEKIAELNEQMAKSQKKQEQYAKEAAKYLMEMKGGINIMTGVGA